MASLSMSMSAAASGATLPACSALASPPAPREQAKAKPRAKVKPHSETVPPTTLHATGQRTRIAVSERLGARERVERVLRLAELLSPADRELILAIYDRQMTVKATALLINRHPGVVRRRLLRILSRLDAPQTHFVLAHGQVWPDERRRVAMARQIRGCSQRATATLLNISLHRVRVEDRAIQAAFQHAQQSMSRAR